MGKLSRTKGHSFEREIANKLKSIFPEARRAVEDAVVNKGIDIANSEPFFIQCKRYKGSVPMSKLEEVVVKEWDIPLLISRVDREREKVTMYLDDWLLVLEKLDMLGHVW